MNIRWSEPGLRGAGYRYYVLTLLVLVYAVNIMDRQVLALLLEDIKHEFLLSDAQLGLLGGIAFAFFYSILGIPLARWADAGGNVRVLTYCVLLWSVATALCGVATGFLSLLLARIGTAIGEAGGSPSSHALIAGYFAPGQRATALSIYALGVPLGAIIGNLASGWLNEFLEWRTVFVLLGLPGVLMALLVRSTLAEPQRVLPAQPALAEAVQQLWRHRSYVHMCVAAALHSVVWYAGSTWNATFLLRSHGLGSGQAGTVIASFSLLALLGTFGGGYYADRLATRYRDARWYMWVPAGAIVGMLPLQFCAYLSQDLSVAVGSFWLMMILAATFFGPAYAVSQTLAGERGRALAASLLLFTQTLIGLGVGPWLAGLLSDWLAPALGAESLRYALVMVGLVNLWSIYHYARAACFYRADLGEAGLASSAAAAASAIA